jgi:hypothetical protein
MVPDHESIGLHVTVIGRKRHADEYHVSNLAAACW